MGISNPDDVVIGSELSADSGASKFSFEVLARDGEARSGVIRTLHGEIKTPVFMPVGTVGAVKAMLPANLREIGTEILLGNTYHLMLRPGAERIAKLGGLHKFINWDLPILTDSGGFQVMSLANLRRISEDGVEFRSHIDGHMEFLSPERAMNIQRLLDSDIHMVLDECPSLPATRASIEDSVALSMRWARRSRAAFGNQSGKACFGIVQGGTFADLRQYSAEVLQEIGFDGYAIGGLAVGETQEAMFETLEVTLPHLSKERPRYLMGVGKPADIIGAVLRGIDMFDCVLPTRSGRNGQAFITAGTLNLRNSRFADDPKPLQIGCTCPACSQFSRAYLHHLIKTGEIIGATLLTWHNLKFYQELMSDLQAAIENGTLSSFAVARGRI